MPEPQTLPKQPLTNELITPEVLSSVGANPIAFSGADNPSAAWRQMLADTNLYRSAADTLKTDDSFVVAGTLTISSVTVSTGTGAPSGGCTTGSLFLRTDGGTNTTLYVCESSAWSAK